MFLDFVPAPGKEILVSAPAPPIKSKSRFLYPTQHLKNLNFNNKKAPVNLDFVTQNRKTFKKNLYTRYKKIYLVLYLTVQ